MQTPFSLRIFVSDGDPDGLRIVDKSNWIGKPEFDTKLRKLLICIGRAFRPATTTGAFERRGRVS